MGNVVAENDTIGLDLVLEKVYQDGGYDFRDYKRGTVTRRLARRLYATDTRTYLEYVHFLNTHHEEYQKLADDLTIKVSGFFRSHHSLQKLTGLILPELLSCKEARREREIRFWSAACARGEEPYSIAILLTEFLGQRRWDFDISIYATDISQQALNQAQAGVYSQSDIENIPEIMRKSYFMRVGEQFQLRDDIRQIVNFSHFDLTSTILPPFSGLNCIFCCNVLIYWQRQLQERVLSMLYNALAVPGYLVLGEVESPTSNIRERLICLDRQAKIYKKVAHS